MLCAAAWWGLTQGHDAEPERAPLLLHKNLIGLLADGEYVRTTTRIAPGSPRGQRHTVDADPRDRAQAVGTITERRDGRTETWLVGRKPEFFVDVVHPAERRLELRLANAVGEPQSVSLFFNGRLLTRAEMPKLKQLVTVGATVPANLQRVGRNRVRLVFDMTAPRLIGERTVALPVAARWDLAVFQHVVSGAASSSYEAAPVDAPATPTTVLADGTRLLRLAPASMVRTGLALPVSQRVVLRYTLRRSDLDYDLGVTSDQGGRVSLRSPGLGGVASAGPVEIELDLTPWAGSTVMIDVRSGEAAGGELQIGPAAILYEKPALSATADMAAPLSDPATSLSRPSILLVTFDALARRHVSGLGHDRWTTPNLDRLIEQGLVFSDATASASTTAAALASLHLGQSPFVHGVDGPGRALPSDAASLASHFAAAGWRTAGFVAHPEAGRAHGFDTGFDVFVEQFDDAGGAGPGSALVAPLQEFLEGVGTQPFFVWVHLSEPGAPYAAPLELQRALVRPYEGSVRGDLDWLQTWSTGDAHVEWEGWSHLRDLYDARVAQGDAVLGQLVQSLQWPGHESHTLVAVTSAHGESMGHHGSVQHGDSVYAEQLNVPLVMHGPGIVPGRVRGSADLTDLWPTLLGRGGLPVPDGSGGIDLFAADIDAERGMPARSGGTQAMLGWRRGSLQFVLNAGTRKRALYDLDADPGQRQDLRAKRPATAARLERELLRAWCAGSEFQAELQAERQVGSGDQELPASGPECARLRAGLRRL